MDVLVHYLALEQLACTQSFDIDLTAIEDSNRPLRRPGTAPRSERAETLFAMSHKVDWVARSQLLTDADGGSSVLDRAMEISGRSAQLVVRYAPGGQLVGGAVDAAIGMCLGQPAAREISTARPIDRSVEALREQGWSHGDLRSLLSEWARFDDRSAVVVLDLGDNGFSAAHHELTCRYDLIHSEYDYITIDDEEMLAASGSGSAHTLLLRAEADAISAVLERHRSAVIGSYVGDLSVIPLTILWSPTRQVKPDAAHDQRMRKLRYKERTTQLLERARGR